ncbi:hypothetical protein [Rhodocytophaga rosea]|nr:hypothetical protein [Rhodocytophaga rosea]
MKTLNKTKSSSKGSAIPIVLPSDQVSLKKFLTDPARKDMLSINGIERQAGLSQGIVSKFVHGKRALHPKQVEKLLPVVKLIGYLL